MPAGPDPFDGTRNGLAKALRDLRGASGMSGEQAAAATLMSQSKVSRIETGRFLPTLADVEQMLLAYGADAPTADRVRAMARAASQQYRAGRADVRRGIERKQAQLAGFERTARVVRHFLPAAPTGLLHTRAYAEATLAGLGTVPASAFAQVVDAKMNRQMLLGEAGRRFEFLLTETAVRARVAPLGVLAGQCAHMADLAELDNVSVAVAPFASAWPSMALNTFVLYDDRFVTCELFSGEVQLHDPQDVAHHAQIFNAFLEVALTGADAAALLRSAAAEYAAMDRSSMRERA